MNTFPFLTPKEQILALKNHYSLLLYFFNLEAQVTSE